MLFHSNIYNIEKLFNMQLDITETHLASKEVYNIPFYQREYVWTSIEAEKLLFDIYHAFIESSPQYFLGGIVLNAMTIGNDDKFIDIVDGQQRTITLSIILAVLYNFLQQNKQKFIDESGIPETNILAVYRDKFEKIKALVVKHESSLDNGTKSYFKINTNKHIEEAYEHFINFLLLENESNQYNSLEEYIENGEVNNIKTYANIVDVGNIAFSFFTENLYDIRQLENFVPYLLQKVLLVTTVTNDLKTAFQIFVTLNDRGIGLSPDDLIKSFLIKNVSTNYEKYSDLWDEFVNNLQDEKGKFITKPLDFFDQLFLSEGNIVSNEKIFDYFNENYAQEHSLNTDIKIEDFLKKLKLLSEYHINNKKTITSLEKLNIDNSYATLLALYPIKNKPEQIKKFIKHLERIAIVYFFNGHTKSVKQDLAKLNKIIHDGLNGMNAGNQKQKIRKTYKKFAKKAHELINEKSENFENSLIKMNIPKSGKRYNQVKYLLSIIAYKVGGAQYDIGSPETTIEHIMPLDKPTDGCYESILVDKYQIYNKRIGNLTIMNKDLNQLLGNECPEEKFNIIRQQSPDFFTSSIIDSSYENDNPPYGQYKEVFSYSKLNEEDTWNVEEIEHRSIAIARIAKYIWVDGKL